MRPRPLIVVAGALSLTAALSVDRSSPLHAAARCTLRPGSTLAVVRVERDTTLPFAPARLEPMSATGMGVGPRDSLLATPETLMPAARVRLLRLDSTTRAILAGQGITDSQPIAYIRAAPYRADCRTIRWTDTVPFVKVGDVGYVRATLAPRQSWIDRTPVLVIPDAWSYPYPYRRSLAFNAAPDAQLTPAESMFSLSATLEMQSATNTEEGWAAARDARRTRAMEWIRTNLAAADLEPARRLVREAVLEPDWRVAERIPSRLRGTYRVDLEAGGERSTWFFRTTDRPGYSWPSPSSPRIAASLIASPYVTGYRLVGRVAGSPDSIVSTMRSGPVRPAMVWLATDDRPTMPGNDARRVLSGMLEFTLSSTPEVFWNDLDSFVPKVSPVDSAMRARMNFVLARRDRQPQLPLRVQLDGQGGVRADTTLTAGGRVLRVTMQRIDTVSIKRPF